MSIGESLLAAFSRTPGASDYADGHSQWNEANSLSVLERVYPEIRKLIADRNVLDYGCGEGHQSVALAAAGARSVVGLDTHADSLKKAAELGARSAVAGRLSFVSDIAAAPLQKFDVVISQNAMEHFPDPDSIVRSMRGLLAPGGRLLITFGPPWYAPYGSHMQFFTRIPWVNLLFSERTVMNVRGRFRNDGAKRYQDVEAGLNQMSIGKFERILREQQLVPVFRKYECVKGMNVLAHAPLVRELLINHVTVLLSDKR